MSIVYVGLGENHKRKWTKLMKKKKKSIKKRNNPNKKNLTLNILYLRRVNEENTEWKVFNGSANYCPSLKSKIALATPSGCDDTSILCTSCHTYMMDVYWHITRHFCHRRYSLYVYGIGNWPNGHLAMFNHLVTHHFLPALFSFLYAIDWCLFARTKQYIHQ